MDPDSLGKMYSLLAAVSWASALVLFKRSGEQVPPLALNLFKNVVGILLLAVTLAGLRDGLNTLQGFPREDIYILVVSGVIGIALADTILFHSLNLIGVGILSIVDCLYSPLIILFSAVLLSEQLSVLHYLGAGLILVGVAVSSGHQPPPDRTRGQLIAGVFWGVLALVCIALSIVMAKPVLEGADFPILWATMIRMAAGTAALVLLVAASPARHTCWAAFRPSAVWRVSIPGSVLGAYLAMIFWIAGFKLTQASIAGILSQTSVIFAIVLATVVLKERFTTRKLVALTLAMGGIVLVTLNEVILGVLQGAW